MKWARHDEALRKGWLGPRVLLIAVSVAHVFIASGVNAAAQCSELSERRDRLHAEIDRLRADAAIVEAQLGALCAQKTDVGVPPQMVPASATFGPRTDETPRLSVFERNPLEVEPNLVEPNQSRSVEASVYSTSADRRKAKEELRDKYATHCYGANTSFNDPSCNCFGKPRPPTVDSLAAVVVVVGGWLGASVDAWLLKLFIEEQLGRPTELISDADLFAKEGGVWGALKSGRAMMYPEVWLSQEGEAYSAYVKPGSEVQSAGNLGVQGQNGWYVLESEIERWPALAGYRGLREPDVQQHFNGTLYSFGTYGVDSDTWGPQEELLKGLGLDFRVVWMGDSDTSEALIKSRLSTGLPMLFYLWDPHPLIDEYKLSRIQLPRYEAELFWGGKSDFPVDVLEKVFSAGLARLAPEVHSFYYRFRINNAAQRQIMRAVDSQDLSVLQAACTWLKDEANAAVLQRWMPTSMEPTCSDFEIILDGEAFSLDYLGALRESIVKASAQSCRRCLLAVVISVFGERFISEWLHLVVDEPLLASACPPALASRIASVANILYAAQALLLENAVRSHEPVGLSITLPTNSSATLLVQDLFLPTDATADGEPVLRGIDTNHSIFVCSRTKHLDTWVISSSGERSTWAKCEGEVWIDRLSGKAQLVAAAGGSSSAVTFVIHRGLSEACGSVLRSVAMPAVHGGTLAFPKTIGADEVACWLTRLFGPYSAIPVDQVPREIELPEGLGTIFLLTDLVLARGRSLVVRGGNNTVLVGSCQVRVQARFALTLDSIIVANSVRSTAIAIEAGSVRLSTSTVRNCSAYMNAVNADGLFESRGGAISVNTAGRLELVLVDMYANIAAEGESASSGGAIYCAGGSSISIIRSKLHDNVAHRAGLSKRDFYGIAQGGAVYLQCKSSLVINESELFKNVASDGGFKSLGGAVYGCNGTSVTIRGSKLYENRVENGGMNFSAADKEGAQSWGGAVFVERECSAEVIDCEMCDNLARAGAQWTEAGAIGVNDGSSLLIVRSKLLRNAALGGGDGVDAGAVYVCGGDRPSIAWLNESEISDNQATAIDGGSLSNGGAVFVLQAQLTVVDCKLHRNVASGGDHAFGGAFFFDASSRVLMQRSDVIANIATGGAWLSQGGGIYSDIGVTGDLRIESTALRQNCANGSATPAAGGALHSKSGSATLVDSDLAANVVAGQMANGGAVYAASGTVVTIRTTISRNSVYSMGAMGEAFGGGLYNDGAKMRLVDSLLVENVASIASPSLQASAGALYNAVGAQAILDGCVLRSNTAGGTGLLQATSYSYDNDRRMAYEASKAAHIFTSGVRVELIGTVIAEESTFIPIEQPAQRWIVVGGGILYLHSSNFSAAKDSAEADSDARLWLLASSAQDAEILVRQCIVKSLKLQSATKVGVVNSEFEPPLNSSASSTVPPEECTRVVANEQMCDPRALCELRKTSMGVPSGGMQCACIGGGVHEKPGALTNGRQCEQDTVINMLTQSHAISITVPKPSNGTADLGIVVQATGESRVSAAYTASMVRFSGVAGDGLQMNSSHAWRRLDGAQLSLDGHHLIWSALPPADDNQIELNAGAKRYAVTKEYAFRIGLDCHGEAACVADGDTVETVIEVASDSGGGGVLSAVRITTLIQALASCNHSVAVIMQSDGSSKTAVPVTDSLYSNAALVFIDLRVVDADGIPIRVNQPASIVFWGSKDGSAYQIVPTRQAEGGSFGNRYTAGIEASLRGAPGSYRLQVLLKNAWSETFGAVSECVLLEQVVQVKEPDGLTTVWLSVASLSGCALLLGVILFWARRMSAELRHVLVMVLTESSKTVTSISFAIGNLSTDLYTTYRVVFEGIVKSRLYRVPYAVFGCLSIVAGLLSIYFHVRRVCELHLHIKTNSEVQQSDRVYPVTQEPAEADTDLEGDEDDASYAVMHKLKWELQRTSRDQKGLAVGVLCLLLEDLPMAVLTALLVLREEITDKLPRSGSAFGSSGQLEVITSLLISAAMLGFKFTSLNAVVRTVNRKQELTMLIGELTRAHSNIPQELVGRVRRATDHGQPGFDSVVRLVSLPPVAC